MAIYLQSKVAKEASCDPLIIESDCLYVVYLLNNVLDYFTHQYASFIELCKSDLASFNYLVHILRVGNVVVAHKHAKFVGKNQVEYTVFYAMPFFFFF